VRHPSELVDRLQEHLHRVLIELKLIFPQSDQSSIGSARHDSARAGGLHASTGRGGNKDGKGPSGAASARGGGGSINRDIQRLFTQKISTFGGVEGESSSSLSMDRTAPLGAICKIAFKAIMECVRMERLTAPLAFQQLQLDIYALRQELATCLPEADADLTRVLHVLLDEAVNSALERTQHQMQTMEEYALSELYESSRASRPSALVSPLSPRTARPPTAAESEAAARAAPTRSPPSGSSAHAVSNLQSDKPAGALARLVLSAPASKVPDGSHMMSPTELLQQIHKQNSTQQL
jgi:hypothetical protein